MHRFARTNGVAPLRSAVRPVFETLDRRVLLAAALPVNVTGAAAPDMNRISHVIIVDQNAANATDTLLGGAANNGIAPNPPLKTFGAAFKTFRSLLSDDDTGATVTGVQVKVRPGTYREGDRSWILDANGKTVKSEQDYLWDYAGWNYDSTWTGPEIAGTDLNRPLIVGRDPAYSGDVIFSGADLVTTYNNETIDWQTGWTNEGNGIYSHYWPFDWQAPKHLHAGTIYEPPMARRRNMIFIGSGSEQVRLNERELEQLVDSNTGGNYTTSYGVIRDFATLEEGEFGVYEQATAQVGGATVGNRIYIKPKAGTFTANSTQVEVPTRDRVFSTFYRNRLHLSDFIVEKYNAGSYLGTQLVNTPIGIYSADDSRYTNIISRDNDGWGMRIGGQINDTYVSERVSYTDIKVLNNGSGGIQFDGHRNVIVDGLETAGNNWRGALADQWGWHRSGHKSVGIEDVIFIDSSAHDNQSPGFWLDETTHRVAFKGITSTDNTFGVMLEISDNATITENDAGVDSRIERNAVGLFMGISHDLSIKNTLFRNNNTAVLVYEDLRDKDGYWKEVTGVEIVNNRFEILDDPSTYIRQAPRSFGTPVDLYRPMFYATGNWDGAPHVNAINAMMSGVAGDPAKPGAVINNNTYINHASTLGFTNAAGAAVNFSDWKTAWSQDAASDGAFMPPQTDKKFNLLNNGGFDESQTSGTVGWSSSGGFVNGNGNWWQRRMELGGSVSANPSIWQTVTDVKPGERYRVKINADNYGGNVAGRRIGVEYTNSANVVTTIKNWDVTLNQSLDYIHEFTLPADAVSVTVYARVASGFSDKKLKIDSVVLSRLTSTVTPTSSDTSTTEGGDTASFTISRTAGTDGVQKSGIARVKVTPGGTASSSDYEIRDASNNLITDHILTIPDGQSTATFSVKALADAVAGEGNETLTLTVVDYSGYAVPATPAVNFTLVNVGNDVTDNLVARWKFEDSGALGDDTAGAATDHNGTVSGVTQDTTNKKVGPASARFTANTSSITVPDANDLDNTNKLSVSFWVRPSATGVDGQARGLVSKRASASSNASYSLFMYTGGKLFVDIAGSSRFSHATAFAANTWQHVTLVYDGTLASASRVKLYVNGTLSKTVSNSNAALPNYASSLFLGKLGGSSTTFDGNLDDVRIYNGKALTASEIATIQAVTDTGPVTPTVSITATDNAATEVGAGTGTIRIDRGPGNTTGALVVNLTVSGAASASDYALSGGGISVNGANAAVTIPDGSQYVDVTVTPSADNLLEGSESLTLTLASGSGYTGTGAAQVSIADNPATPAPGSLNAAAASSSQINLTWTDNAGNETGFTVEYSTDPTFATGVQTVTRPADATSASITGLAANTPYSFRVRASDASGISSWSNAATVSTLPAAGTSATLVATDTTTQGSWKGVYGSDGYNVIGDASSYPSYATVATAGTSPFTWAPSTTDARAVQKAASPTDRIASTWYTSTSMSIDVSVTGGTRRVAMYFLDWDTTARAQTVQVTDRNTGAVLVASQSLSSFNGGKYLVFDISGDVRFTITKTGGANAVVSGLFFGT